MLRIAIVEDEAENREQIGGYLRQYAAEQGLEIEVVPFPSGEDILADYQADFDIILLDIELPGINGMETAEHIRAMDRDVVLVFVTNMTQYAIRGYAVDALDYILKPISYYTFSLRLARAIGRVRRREGGRIVLTLPDGAVRLTVRQIHYVEIQNRTLHYHTDLGVFTLRGTMQHAEEELGSHHFVRCNHWYLVNLNSVSEVRGGVAVVAGDELEISRRNRTAFMTALTNYVGGGG